MDTRAKRFWIPWAGVMSVAVLFMLMGAAKQDAGAQVNASWPDGGVEAAYIDVTKVPITFHPEPAKAPAPAATQPIKPDDVQGASATLRNAMHTSNWRLAVLAGLLLSVLMLRKVGGWFLPARAGEWVNSDRGGATLALLAGVLTVLVNGLIAGGKFDPQLIIDGLLAAATAAGTFNLAKRLAKPADKDSPAKS